MGDEGRVLMARESLRIRAMRARYFPEDLYAEYAWVLLLHAYLRQADVAIAEDGESLPSADGTVIRHWRRYLETQALIVRDPTLAHDPVLTTAAIDRMERYLDELAQAASDFS